MRSAKGPFEDKKNLIKVSFVCNQSVLGHCMKNSCANIEANLPGDSWSNLAAQEVGGWGNWIVCKYWEIRLTDITDTTNRQP